MKIELTSEKWNLINKPTVGESYYLLKKGRKIWFNIVEQGWTKTGVYLKLSKKK